MARFADVDDPELFDGAGPAMRVVARRREGFAHDVEIDGGTRWSSTSRPRPAARTPARPPSPRRRGLAGCIAITIEMYAERKGWDLGDVEVDVDVEYDGHAPRSFATSIHLPAELSEEQRERC